MRQRQPLERRNAVIMERFLAGESLMSLAWDYGLPLVQIARIVQHYGRRHDQARLLARLVRGSHA